MSGILDGFRVVEWAALLAGPAAAAILGELGAEVIKIEQPGLGDLARRMTQVGGVSIGLPDNRAVLYESASRHKKSIALNIASEKGRELAYRLVEKSDVFVTNYRTETGKRMGMDYESLSRLNPRLIYASASGYGTQGPLKDEPALDLVVQGYAGWMTAMGEPGSPPTFLNLAPLDQTTATLGAFGIVAALLARERYGFGQEVNYSLLSSAIWTQHMHHTTVSLIGKELPKHDRSRAPEPLRNYYPCGDGKWLNMATHKPDEAWEDLCAVLRLEELQVDPRFRDASARAEHCQELISILDRVFATRSRDDWLRVMRERGMVCAPINQIAELVDDPQVRANNFLVDMPHPVLGHVRFPDFPCQFSRTPADVRSVAPGLGEHTEEVMRMVLGYSAEEIASLEKERVIATAPKNAVPSASVVSLTLR